MTAELLDENSVTAYVIEQGLFSSSSKVDVQLLTGGVSNVVIALCAEGKEYVLKQALPQLRVKSTWLADPRRAIVEARALDVLHAITPERVPRLRYLDPDRFVVVLDRADSRCTNWKEDLLSGKISADVAHQLGETVGSWHKSSSTNPELLNEFIEDELFEQLRINPFYRSLATIHTDIAPLLQKLIDELEGNRTSLVHGDFSPKNILVTHENHAIVLDFEVAHTGNPVFDLAFLLGHFLCKQEHLDNDRDRNCLALCASSFISAYQNSYHSPDPSLAWHLATIALARVDGVSPAGYLDWQGQNRVRERCLRILRLQNPPSIREVFFQS